MPESTNINTNSKIIEMKKNMGLTPSQIVKELDRFIIGQTNAKKAVAIALRNRYRRVNVSGQMQNEIAPKNILMIGSTGVGKTEISKRLATLAEAPFIKIEATKFTEVGYVGRDVESIIRDLLDTAIIFQKNKSKASIFQQAQANAIERILLVLVGDSATEETKNKFRQKILSGEILNTEIQIDVKDKSSVTNNLEIPGMPVAISAINVNQILGKAFGDDKMKSKKLSVKEALDILIQEESEKLLDEDKIISDAISNVENDGVVFLDEIDKIASSAEVRNRGEISREGVQRDLLPLIEGTVVATKYGNIKTDHILFIASGAFHASKPSDLLPELQGRLPIRVELSSLSQKDFIKILKDPQFSLIKQYTALLQTEDVSLKFTDNAIKAIATYAHSCNLEIEDIGARRLHTILEHLLEDISFNADSSTEKNITIDEKFVNHKLSNLSPATNLAKFVL